MEDRNEDDNEAWQWNLLYEVPTYPEAVFNSEPFLVVTLRGRPAE